MNLQFYLKTIQTEAQKQRTKELQNQKKEVNLLAEADNKLKEMSPKIKQLIAILNECHCSGLSIPKSSTEMTFTYVGENPGLSTQTDISSDRILHVYIYDDRKKTLLRKATEDGRSDGVTAKDIESFLLDFVRYENLIYQWLDQLAYSHQKKVSDELPTPDNNVLLDAIEGCYFYSVVKDIHSDKKVVVNKEYFIANHDDLGGIVCNQIRPNGDCFQFKPHLEDVFKRYEEAVCLPISEMTQDTPCGRYLDLPEEELLRRLTQSQAITM